MDTRFLATDFNSLLPIIVLLIFLVIPYVLKMLGRHTSAGRGDEPTEEHDASSGPPMQDEHPGPPVRHDYEQPDRGKPITPRWF